MTAPTFTDYVEPVIIDDVPHNGNAPSHSQSVDAPYGFKADGSPRAKPGRKSGQANTEPRKSATNGIPSMPRPSVKKPNGTKKIDYATDLTGIFAMLSMPLSLAGMKNPVLAADGNAIMIHAAPIAGALSDLANERPEVAAILDRLLSAGPYGALIAAVFPLILQILINHNILPAGILGMGQMVETPESNSDGA